MRDIIVLTAREKIVQYGWRKFTINQIAADLGISKKTVYKYFQSKSEIVSAVLDRFIALEKANALKILESEMSWAEKMQALMGALTPDKPAWVIGELERFFPQEWVKIEDLYKLKRSQTSKLFAKARENGEIRSDIAPEVIFLTISSTIKALHNYKYLGEINLTLNQAVREFAKILFSGILSKKSRDRNQGLYEFSPAGQIPVDDKENDYTRNKIVRVAMEKINQYGFRKFTVDDVAAELGISKKTIYKCFASKNEIISAVVDKYLELEKTGILKALRTEGNWIDKMNLISFSLVPSRPVWVTEELFNFFPQEWEKIYAQRQWRKTIMSELFVKAIENSEIRSDIAPAIIQITVSSTMSIIYDFSNLKRINMTFNQAVAEFLKILFTGILTKKGQGKNII
ncbi:MAG: hypothetical protein CVV03_10265 [Firmicutes bacterium HGW-Firmicutes-8]|nr:MAG: hypothetical protein CVV03_10265 [Firmicutes bacterium HGW-Firmicutes-8]